MKTLIAFAFLAAAAAAQEAQKPGPEHEWLQQLAGEWDTEGEVILDPAKPPLKTKGSESARAVGGFWVVSDLKGEAAGAQFSGHLTLGYQPDKKKYVGTWVDSNSSYLATYQGFVDTTGKILTLEAEAPGPVPGKLSKFREVIEIKNKDHRVFTSSIEQDGKWITFVTVHYRRKK